MQLIIETDGTGRCVYDEVFDVSRLGAVSIHRASHVEPTLDGHWMADLAPVNGPMLGPFPSRSLALQAELLWLTEHWLR